MELALGVDVAEARKGLDLVVLDGGGRVVATKAHARAVDVAALVVDLRPAVVCIDSPPAWGATGRSRAAERALRPLGITAFSTPCDPGPHPFYRWMRAGFEVFDAVAGSHPRYRTGELRGTAVEVFPEATAVLLRGRLRGRGEPKAAFRRQVLADHGVDPSSLRTLDAVDAALAALTGVRALAGDSCTVGDPAEGVILLPMRTLPASSLVRPSVPTPCPVPGRSP